MLIYKVIKGEDNFNTFMDAFRPGWRDLKRVENTWQIFDVYVERFYAKRDDEEYYSEWFWLIMESKDPNKGFGDGQYSETREKVYEGIRAGKITGNLK